ncbi:hypothetical protein ACP70R_003666 [Stipagrostis hirtigluma subsp. patula]
MLLNLSHSRCADAMDFGFRNPTAVGLDNVANLEAVNRGHDIDAGMLHTWSSTLAVATEDDVCSTFLGAVVSNEHEGHGYKTPDRGSNLPYCCGSTFLVQGRVGGTRKKIWMSKASSEKSKVQEFESFVGTTFPDEINIHPPEVAHTKGNGRRIKHSSAVID